MPLPQPRNRLVEARQPRDDLNGAHAHGHDALDEVDAVARVAGREAWFRQHYRSNRETPDGGMHDKAIGADSRLACHALPPLFLASVEKVEHAPPAKQQDAP